MPRPEPIARADIGRLSSFRLPARADELIVLEQRDQLRELDPPGVADVVLGGGSNTVFVGDIRGRVVLNRLRGFSVQRDKDDALVTAAAGENWHHLARRCIDAGLYGLENLALIPGSVGAAPMQNIGAYGVELKDLFDRLEAWDFERGDFVQLRAADCAFGYRDSRFKSRDRGRFLITSITLRLRRQFEPNTRYDSLAGELDRVGVARPDARQLAAAVMRLRRHRLPDPARLPNAGSFFKNPIVDTALAEALVAEHPGLPHWRLSDGRVKIGAGRLIETLGWKGKRVGDAGVYANHALVLVNHGRATASQLINLVDQITVSVEREFGLCLESEPQLIGQL